MEHRFTYRNEMSGSGTVDKALTLLAHLQTQTAPLGVSELGRALRMPKASVHRLLTSLGSRGYVEQAADGRYRLGFGLVALGLAVLAREPLIEAARPALEVAAQALGETLFLAAAREQALVVLDKVEGTGLLRAAPRIGDTAPIHATAVGRLYLALAPERCGAPSPATALPRFTRHTLTTPAALARAVAEVRRRRWAESREEWIPGLAFLAGPVLVSDRLVGAIAAAIPTVRLDRNARQRALRAVLDAAAATAARLQGRIP